MLDHTKNPLRSKTELLILEPDIVNEWVIPEGVQRNLHVNKHVCNLRDELLSNGGVLTSIISLGRVAGDPRTFVVDGMHRLEAFKMAGIPELYVEVKTTDFDSMADLAKEFVKAQTPLVRMTPDDSLRAMANFTPALAAVKEKCSFVGYDNVRRKGGGTMLSMSAVIRTWTGSRGETPSLTSNGKSAQDMAHDLDEKEVENLCRFLNLAFAVWNVNPEYFGLWANLNMCMTMWLYRTLVIEKPSTAKRYLHVSEDHFQKCLMSVSANQLYIDWLKGRQMSERDRSPCYRHLRGIFSARLRDEIGPGKHIKLPQPSWFGGRG